ncbi:MAG: TauD/TfdA family dioxygenase [Roseovarius sp.]
MGLETTDLVEKIDVNLEAHGLTLHPANGPARYINYLWLRDNCPTSWSGETHDRSFDITSVSPNLTARAARVEGNTLAIEWNDGQGSAEFDLDWLRRWLDAPGIDDPAAIEPGPWRAEKAGNVRIFGFDALLQDFDTRCDYLETMMRDGLALVNGVPESNDSITRIASIAGIVRGGFSGQYFNVRTYPKPAGAAYTANALEPHTDNPCEQAPPDVQYLHCLQNDASGGQSTFADGLAAALDLRRDDPEAFDLLARHDVPFCFACEGIDMRARQKVIITDWAGAITGVTVSQHMAGIFDLDQRLLDRYYPAFIRFLKMLRAPEYEITLTLRAGQCVVFDNQRIVHGRRAFDPTSGGRLLRGCYTDRGEMRSRYRVLRRDGEIRDQKPQGAD